MVADSDQATGISDHRQTAPDGAGPTINILSRRVVAERPSHRATIHRANGTACR